MSRPRVLNTRPREQAAELSQRLRAAGYEPIERPAIEVVPASDPRALADIAQRLRGREYAYVVFSSVNAARFFKLPLDGTPVVCGAATARALGIQPALALERFSAAAVLQALEGSRIDSGARVLVPRAADGRDELIAGLQQRGVLVDAPVCYRTVAAQIPTWQPVDAITLCSPSAVSALVAAWTPERMNDARVVCIGATTAETARTLGLRVDAMAQSTSMQALVAAVDGVLGARV